MRQCPKCNEVRRIIGPRFNPSTNMLDFTCGTCGFEWNELTADTKNVRPDVMDQLDRLGKIK